MSGTALSHWLERWLGAPLNSAGDATRWRLEYSWPFAPWISLLGALALAAAVGWYYSRRATAAPGPIRVALMLLRLLQFAVLAVMLSGVTLALQRMGLPTLLLLVDDSQSMNIADSYPDAKQREAAALLMAQQPAQPPAASAETTAAATRFELARSWLRADNHRVLHALASAYRLKVYFVGETPRPVPGSLEEVERAIAAAEARGAATHLGECLRGALADQRGTTPAAAIMLTDGITTEGESLSAAAPLAGRKGLPLFIVGLGSEAPRRDLAVEDLLVDDEVFVDDTVDFQVRLRAFGLEGRPAEVTLRLQATSEVLSRASVEAGADGETVDVHLPYRPTVEGAHEFEVLVEPLAEEQSTSNNRLSRQVVVRREQIRVLLADGLPRFEFRYLKHLLERERTIRLQTYLQSADAEYAVDDPTALRVFPVRRDELVALDVVILGDLDPTLASSTSLAALRELVEQLGGGMALVAGEHHNPASYRQGPLAPLFPLDMHAPAAPLLDVERREGLVMEPTELGRAVPFMQLADSAAASLEAWRSLPRMYWYTEVAPKPTAQVLAELGRGAGRPPSPLVVLQYFGAGKVVFHATDESWRWRYRVGDVYFARYWLQLVRYLSRSKLLGREGAVELTADRREYQRGEPVLLRVRYRTEREAPDADEVTVAVDAPSGRTLSATLRRQPSNRGLFEGQIGELEAGLHHARLMTAAAPERAPRADFRVVVPPGEFATTPMAVAELQEAARATRGKFYRLGDADRLLSELPAGRQIPIEALPPAPLWNRGWLLALWVGLLVAEWILRKQYGMI